MLIRYPESILNGDPHVESAVMLDRGRFDWGAILDPMPEFVFDPEDGEKLAGFGNGTWCASRDSYTINRSPQSKSTILPGMFPVIGWVSDFGFPRPTVERMNEFAPQHLRLFKEASPSSPHPLRISFLGDSIACAIWY